MERTVPSTASEEVELYTRTYYSLLRSTADVQIRTLEEAHAGMKSLLHPTARELAPDMAALIYSLLRLPACMRDVQLVVMGQSVDVFAQTGVGNVETWQPVSAPARRRRCFFNGKDTLACFIASRSDIDDIIPMLAAYEIEWNKLHNLLKRLPGFDFSQVSVDHGAQHELVAALQISLEDLERLKAIWGEQLAENLQCIAATHRSLKVRLLSGSWSDYRRATSTWWANVLKAFPALKDRPVYFVSSNTHSIANLLSGFALSHQEELVKFLEKPANVSLLNEWNDIQSRQVPSSLENFLYYILKKFESRPEGRKLAARHRKNEIEGGVLRVPSKHVFDVEAQVIDLSHLRAEWLDPRLCPGDMGFLSNSDALILNIDYPLGLAAYNILAEVAEQVGKVVGVYVMGKAAALNAAIGDVVIPNVVHDEQSKNTYLFSNCFSAADVAPYLVYGTVLDNQKAVTVQGTFLQTAHYMDVFYREGYTDIEMEAGPYLSAIYEMYRPQRHPANEIVNLYELAFDLGIVHYVSDTPLSKGKNLGTSNLSYFGMDSTYAVSVAVLQRILRMEQARVGPFDPKIGV